MLTRAQIQRLAQRNRIGVQVQERDYLQNLLLYLLYNRSQALAFKGGTAVRIVYGGNRFSEDLDFNAPADVELLKSLWQLVSSNLLDFGIFSEIRNSWLSDVGYSFDVSYQGPLFDGRDRTKGKVRVDLNLRPEAVETHRALISPEHDDLRPFVITVLTPEQLLAEKVRALLVRSKPRDVYDIWLLIHQGVKMNRALVADKLALYSLSLTIDSLAAALDKAHLDWKRDLFALLPQFLSWEDIAGELTALWKVVE